MFHNYLKSLHIKGIEKVLDVQIQEAFLLMATSDVSATGTQTLKEPRRGFIILIEAGKKPNQLSFTHKRTSKQSINFRVFNETSSKPPKYVPNGSKIALSNVSTVSHEVLSIQHVLLQISFYCV